MTEKRQCDGCGVTGTSKTIHGFRTIKNSNDSMIMSCRKCWNVEMTWRKNKNARLPVSERYPVRPWRS